MRRVVGLFFLLVLPLPSLASDYLLGAGDQLRLKAVIWNETDRQFEAWDVVGGEYAVQSDGTLSIPIVGSVEAAGQAVAAVAASISEKLQDQGGIAAVPTIALEVLNYRPFFILGDVRNPGSYRAQPGLTALQAVALAGGSGAPSDETRPSNLIREAGSLREIRGDLARVRIREARLEAEIDDAENMDVPQGLSHPDGPDALALIEAQERAIFDARKAELARELAALSDLDDLLSNEVASLDSKLEGQREQLRLARETMDSAESLVERGLAPAARLADAQARLIDLEGRETDVLNSIYRARQRISENQRDIVALQAGRATGATIELQRTKAELEDLAVRRQVVQEVILAEGDAIVVLEGTETRTSYTLRPGTVADGETGAAREIGPDDPMLPGDVLTVRVELIDGPSAATGD